MFGFMVDVGRGVWVRSGGGACVVCDAGICVKESG